MKRTPLKRIGKIGRANIEASKRLTTLMINSEITECEVQLDGCLISWALTWAHRHKRLWYKGDIEKLSDLKQVVLACVECHRRIEHDAVLTEAVFMRLRGEEN